MRVAPLRGSEMLVRLLLLSVAVASGSAFCVSLKPHVAARRSLPHTAPTMVMVPLKDTEVCPHSLPMPRGFGCLPSHPDPSLHSFLVRCCRNWRRPVLRWRNPMRCWRTCGGTAVLSPDYHLRPRCPVRDLYNPCVRSFVVCNRDVYFWVWRAGESIIVSP